MRGQSFPLHSTQQCLFSCCCVPAAVSPCRKNRLSVTTDPIPFPLRFLEACCKLILINASIFWYDLSCTFYFECVQYTRVEGTVNSRHRRRLMISRSAWNRITSANKLDSGFILGWRHLTSWAVGRWSNAAQVLSCLNGMGSSPLLSIHLAIYASAMATRMTEGRFTRNCRLVVSFITRTLVTQFIGFNGWLNPLNQTNRNKYSFKSVMRAWCMLVCFT